MDSLPLFHRLDGQSVIVLGHGATAQAKRQLVERAGAKVVSEDDGAARLAFIALDAPEESARRLRARGLLINVVDRPDLCDFMMPSVLERGPVLIAIGTGGKSAGLAKALRLRLEALLPASLGTLAQGLFAARPAIRARWAEADARRRALDTALAAGGALDPLVEGGEERVEQWLAGAGSAQPFRLEFTLRSDDPDDLTLREARALGQADLIIHDPGVPAAILNRARADAALRPIAGADDAATGSGSVVTIRRRG